MLETQSCNHPAIGFYRAAGFGFIGCDLTAYGDQDVVGNEVRIELYRSVARRPLSGIAG